MLLNPAGSTQCPRGECLPLQKDQALHTQYDFWGPVMSGRDNCAVMLMIKRGTAKVHHSDGCALHAPLIPLLCEGERYQLLKRVSRCGLSPFLTQPRLCHRVPRDGKASEGMLVLTQSPDKLSPSAR